MEDTISTHHLNSILRDFWTSVIRWFPRYFDTTFLIIYVDRRDSRRWQIDGNSEDVWEVSLTTIIPRLDLDVVKPMVLYFSNSMRGSWQLNQFHKLPVTLRVPPQFISRFVILWRSLPWNCNRFLFLPCKFRNTHSSRRQNHLRTCISKRVLSPAKTVTGGCSDMH